jgi:predicted PurR-regulated permease PerM
MKAIDKETYSRVRSTAEITLVILATILVTVSILYFIVVTRAVLLDFIIAIIIAAALAPVVSFLQKHGLKRIWASVVSLIATVILMTLIIGAIATPLFTQGVTLIENAPKIVNNLTADPSLAPLNAKYHLNDTINHLSNQALSGITNNSSSAIGFAGTLFNGFTTLVISLIFAFFLLIDGPKAWGRFLHLWSRENAVKVNDVGHKILHAITGFVSGNLFISLIAGVVTLVLLLVMHVPYAFALSALVALFDLIPLIGAALATVIVALVALTQGLNVALIVIIVLLTYQFLEGHFIQPAVYSRSVALSALVIIVASVVGAELMGITGVILAIPAAAVIQIIIVEFFIRKEA